MTDPDFSLYAAQHTLGKDPIPAAVLRAAGADTPELAWKNDLGGLTFRIGERFIKWNPRPTGVDLARERDRLSWLTGRHPAPRVLGWGEDVDAQWLVTSAVPGEHAVGDRWRARRSEAIAAIADGSRALHAVPITDFPPGWTEAVWVGRRPASIGPRPPLTDPVLVHGNPSLDRGMGCSEKIREVDLLLSQRQGPGRRRIYD